jgi:hypothetical protein
MFEVLKKLDDAFNCITYYDEPHVYSIKGKDTPITSVTTLLSQYKEKFDAEYWAQRKADEEGVSKEDKLEEWTVINKIATTKGTIIHNYLEDLLSRKIFPYPEEYAISEVGALHAKTVKTLVDCIIPMCDQFVEDISGKLLPVKSELVVGDESLGVCGMVDQVFFNYKANEMQIWDWKTNKKLRRTNPFGKFLKGKLSHLPECELSIYSLQLSVYKELIEYKANVKIGKTYIVWFFEENETYEIIECLDLKKEARYILFGEDF